MKRVALLLCMLALCTAAAGCAQETALQLPFDAAQVTGVEMYRFTVPADAEKKEMCIRDRCRRGAAAYWGKTWVYRAL